MGKVALKVEGMMCDGCRTGVEKALKGVEGVMSAEVDLDKGMAEVSGTAEVAALVAAVEAKGKKATVVPDDAPSAEMESAIDAALRKAKEEAAKKKLAAAAPAASEEPAPAKTSEEPAAAKPQPPAAATATAEEPVDSNAALTAAAAAAKEEGVPYCRVPNCIVS